MDDMSRKRIVFIHDTMPMIVLFFNSAAADGIIPGATCCRDDVTYDVWMEDGDYWN